MVAAEATRIAFEEEDQTNHTARPQKTRKIPQKIAKSHVIENSTVI